MAQRNRNEGLVVLLVAVGAPLLYYLLAGQGKEKDAALIPNDLEGRVDLVVDALNRQFGKHWGDLGLQALRFYLQNVLPPQVVALVNVIYSAEQYAKFTEMSGYHKQQTAVAWAR
jgi:hypothetical protein